MNQWIKRGALAALCVGALGSAALVAGAQWGDRKAQRIISVPLTGVALRSDPAGVERGKYLYRSRGCADCHGADGAGREFINDGKGMRIRAPNISPWPGGV